MAYRINLILRIPGFFPTQKFCSTLKQTRRKFESRNRDVNWGESTVKNFAVIDHGKNQGGRIKNFRKSAIFEHVILVSALIEILSNMKKIRKKVETSKNDCFVLVMGGVI